MSILDKHLAFVNKHVAFQEKRAAMFASDPKRQKLHKESAEKFRLLAADLTAAGKVLDDPARNPPPITLEQQLNLFPTELEGLPEELLKELSTSDADRTEHTILKLLEQAGGVISLDRLLVGLFHKTGEIHKRVTLTSRMYRMSQKGFAYPVPGKKGVYSLRQLTEEEVEKLFTAPPPLNAEVKE